MDFMFGLLTGIFAIVVALALFVVHVLKVKLDLPAPKTNGHHYPNGSIISHHNNGDIVGAALKSRESTPGPDFTDVSEARLRNMIQKIIAETVNMAPLSKSYAVSEIALDRPSKLTENMGYTTNGLRHRTEHYFEPTIYQDLLATAVLNKIVDKQSNNNNRNMSESSPDLSRRDEIADGQADDDTTGLDQNYNIENQSITSGSSVEPRSECSYTDTEPIITANNDKSSEFVLDAGRDSALSDYIAAHMVPLPNLSKLATESEEDDYMSVTSSAVGDSTWENNWLFKKKKSTVSSSLGGSSVGMLVPDPKEDVRAQIGDKTADEISDLSELGSDTDDSSLDLLRSNVDPINDRLFNKHLIGGQNSKLVLDELIERSSMISNTLPTDQEQLYTETRNENVEAPNRTEAINSGVAQQTNNNEEDQKNLEAIMPPVDFDDSSSNPLTDQISSNSTSHNDVLSRVSTVEEFFENTDDDEKDFLVDKLNMKKTKRKTTTTSTGTSTTNNIAATFSNKRTRVNNIRDNTSATSSCLRTNPNNPTTTTNKKVPSTFEHTKQSATCVVQHVANGYVAKKDIAEYDDNNDVSQNEEEEDDELGILRRFVPGSIAEREYKKWYNAVEMPNNPYAPEALKRRISGSQERFIDLPKISPSAEQCPLDMITKDTLTGDESDKRECEIRRYSRDYYINDCAKSSQITLSDQDTSKDATETTEQQLEPSQEHSSTPAPSHETQTETDTETVSDLYTAIPAQVVEDTASSLDTMSQQSMQSANTTTSDDSDTIKIYNFKKQETTVIKEAKEKSNDLKTGDQEEEAATQPPTAATKERPTALSFNRAESLSAPATVTTPTRGSTPEAFKFLQPKRKLLDPSQVMSVDEDEPEIPTGSTDKPVIEKEVVKALPSVKALAKAFLMTSSSVQHSSKKITWPRKAKTLPEGMKSPTKTTKLLEPTSTAEDKSEDDATIASDLSSLETDSLSVPKQQAENTKDQTPQTSSPDTTPPTAMAATTAGTSGSPVPVRHGVLKSNIAFFENLKNLK